ncbi:MAG: glycosyltransferase family 9 protein [Rhodocyclaceae bacterium]|nr:glycosyltransferase family 9 protein [Rhodocyclaceae bacterium]
MVPPPKTILIIVVSRIGDTLFATPMMRAIAQAYPEAEITALGHPKRAQVFAHLPWISRVGVIDKRRAPWLGRFGRPYYDLAFVTGFDEPLIAYALRVARHVVAFEQANPRLNERLAVAVPKPAFQSEHAVLQLLRLPAAMGIEPAGLRIAYCVSEEERKAAHIRLAKSGLNAASPLIGFQVASYPTKSYRDWPIENFAALAEKILARWPKARFLIYGGWAERGRTDWLEHALAGHAVSFAGRLSLRETAALMSLTHLYVGVDTGPTHIMSAFDIPLIAMYHCLSPSTMTGPLAHPCAYLIDHPAGRENCRETTPMAEIAVETVLAHVEQALEEHPPPL